MRNTTTRLLLTCAAIGVGAGLPLGLAGYLHVVVLAAVPVLYGFLIGIYFFPGAIAQALLRRPGVALFTGVFAGLTSSIIDPAQAGRHIGVGLLIGLIQEAPAAIGRYRYWRAWPAYLASVIAGGVLAVIMSLALRTIHFGEVAQIVFVLLFLLAPAGYTWLARTVAAGIDRTGAARGLQGPVRPAPRPSAEEPHE